MFESGAIDLFQSPALLSEIERVLGDPEIQSTAPSLTPEVPDVFTLPAHPKDDHILNLAIAARADSLVVWERRLLELDRRHPGPAAKLLELVAGLKIVEPPTFSRELRRRQKENALERGQEKPR